MTQTIVVPIPPSTNGIWRMVRRRHRSVLVVSKHYRNWLDVTIALMRHHLQPAQCPCRIDITIQGGKGWRITRDLDNVIKPVVDALRYAHVLPDDSCQYVVFVSASYVPCEIRRTNAECIITISEVKNEGMSTPDT